MAHEYLGTRDSRAVRKWSKLNRGQPQPVALDRIVALLAGRAPDPPPVSGSGIIFNPPQLVRGPR